MKTYIATNVNGIKRWTSRVWLNVKKRTNVCFNFCPRSKILPSLSYFFSTKQFENVSKIMINVLFKASFLNVTNDNWTWANQNITWICDRKTVMKKLQYMDNESSSIHRTSQKDCGTLGNFLHTIYFTNLFFYKSSEQEAG